jgi:PEGA domain
MFVGTGWRPGRRSLFLCLCILTGIFFITGCVPEVYKQSVPVSTNPMGAKVYVDGKLAGETPTAVELERNKNHVLTLVKENYRQADVVINRKKNTEEQLFKAINSGVTSGMFFKDPGMGMMRAMDDYNTQEKTGEAYELTPSAVTVDLEPLSGVKDRPRKSGHIPQEGRGAIQPKENQPATAPSEGEALAKGALGAAAMVGAVAAGGKEKRWETSSSTKTSVRPDGTVVTKHSSTSVGVSVNPAGVMNLIDTLYK